MTDRQRLALAWIVAALIFLSPQIVVLLRGPGTYSGFAEYACGPHPTCD